ncbi:hypothetical protein ZWY2020_047256 [Hordeum vulgare]|nr:hypothetical protein ZWY2020_047256 [Hordeum vulgare]
MSEYANKRTRGAFMAAVFAMQGFSILAGGIVTLIISSAFRAGFHEPAYQDDRVASTGTEADFVWRIILMLGALPALLTYYWRTKMPETARYTALVARTPSWPPPTCQGAAGGAGGRDGEDGRDGEPQGERLRPLLAAVRAAPRPPPRRHSHHVVPAGHRLLQPEPVPEGHLHEHQLDPQGAHHERARRVFRISRAQTLIALCGTVPGYWFTVFLIDVVSRFAIQLMGFFMMTVFMLGLAVPYHHWTTPGNQIGFVVMCGFTFFFANFGPNATTFVVPAEIFPARLRSTCHGISAAAGRPEP